MTPEQTAERAERAERLCKDKLLNECFDALEADWLKRIVDSSYNDSEGREKAYRHLSAVREVRNALFRMVKDGVLAKAEAK